MGLKEVQETLATLYTNSSLRAEFAANPQAVGAKLGLSSKDIAQLAPLAAKQLENFANSLKAKRLNEVSKQLTLSEQALGKQFAELFLVFADTYLPHGIKKHYHDAQAFAQYLQQVPTLTPWLKDLVCYEALNLQTNENKPFLRVKFFNCLIQPILRDLHNKQLSNNYRGMSIGVWLKWPGQEQPRHWLLSFTQKKKR